MLASSLRAFQARAAEQLLGFFDSALGSDRDRQIDPGRFPSRPRGQAPREQVFRASMLARQLERRSCPKHRLRRVRLPLEQLHGGAGGRPPRVAALSPGPIGFERGRVIRGNPALYRRDELLREPELLGGTQLVQRLEKDVQLHGLESFLRSESTFSTVSFQDPYRSCLYMRRDGYQCERSPGVAQM